jgi:uroporphyrinogen-III decarboxylase
MGPVIKKYGKEKVICGNVDSRILTEGNMEDVKKEVKRCMDIGRKCPGFFMAIGNHISPGSSIENLLYYNDCYEKMSIR